MEIKIKNNVFWLLECKEDKRILDNRPDAIKIIKDLIKNGADTQEIKLYSIDVGAKEMKVSGTPWHAIVSELIKLEG